MIAIDKPKLKFLDAGRTLTVEHPDPQRYHRGRNYQLRILEHRTIRRRVEILEIHAAGITIRLARYYDPPRLLAARSQYGYTDNPAQALRDEPEAISPDDLNRLAQQAQHRFAQQRADELEAQRARSIAIRLKQAAGRDPAAYKHLHAELGALVAGTADITFG